MSDNPASPLLGGEDEPQNSNLNNENHTTNTNQTRKDRLPPNKTNSDEATPLLSRVDGVSYDGEDPEEGEDINAAPESSRTPDDGENNPKKRSPWRWPIIGALVTLIAIVIVILGVGFAMPSAVEEYAQDAAVFEPKDLSIEEYTEHGIKARVKGGFRLDSSRVTKKSVRDLGRAGTWLAGAVETRPTIVEISLPEYGNVAVGHIRVPKVVVSVRDGHVTQIDMVADVIPGQVVGLKHVAMDWIEGRLGQLRVQGRADVSLKSGIFSLGKSSIAKTLTLANSDIPAVPKHSIDKINVHELPDGDGMSADVSISAFNEFPITFTVPPLAFEILVAGCLEGDDLIKLADATTKEIEILPCKKVHAHGRGVVRELEDSLLAHCPGSNKSPLDSLLGGYIKGDTTTMFVKGADLPGKTPDWISELTKSLTVPVPVTGKAMGDLIRNFTMADVHFSLPNPLADPDSEDAQPKVSATVKVIVNLPKEMNFPIDVGRVRSKPDVYYKGNKLGVLDLNKWRPATSQRLEGSKSEKPGLLIETVLKNAPIWITDQDTFSAVIQEMIMGGAVTLKVRAEVDIEVDTSVGKFVVRDIPAKGEVPIHPLPSGGGGLGKHLPQIDDLQIIETSAESIVVEVKANITNPTKYSATVPYVNINVMNNGTVLAQGSVESLDLVPGLNEGVVARGIFNPSKFGGVNGTAQAREMLSQYLSGYNTTISLATHEGTFPSNPMLGRSLQSLRIDVPAPKLGGPKKPSDPGDGDGDDDGPHFVSNAVMHLLTSTATFTLTSPLRHITIFVTKLDVTALYNHTESVGQIHYDLPIAIPPGSSDTPRLPVDWTLDSVGYDAVKDALGGSLKLDSKAKISFAIGEYHTRVW